jgi:O-antigen/teichoic acid export membrane protein
MMKSGLILSAGNLSVALLSLVRNIVIARLISVEDFGIASTFAITMALVEMTSSIALDRLMIQAKDGETEHLQSTVQAIQAARGALGAAILFLIAGPLALFFRVPELAWAYQALAALPLLRGFAHFDLYRFQREMRFLPAIKVEMTAQFLSTAGAIAFAYVLTDYRAMLYALLVQQIAYTLATHLVAVRPYRWAADRQILVKALSFGWPLLLNGLLMFGVFHGDRIIVGSLIGLTELGWFSAAFSLTLVPMAVVAKTLHSFFLPQLSGAQDRPTDFASLADVTMQAGLFAGALFAVAVAIAGPAIMLLLYGPKYEPALTLIVFLAVMQSLRIAKAGPAIVATAKAETTNPLIANFARILMLPGAWVAVLLGGTVSTVIALAIIGEALAFAVSLYLLHRRLSLTLWRIAPSVAVCMAVLAWVGVDNLLFYRNPYDLRSGHILLAALPLVVIWSMPSSRNWARRLLQTR